MHLSWYARQPEASRVMLHRNISAGEPVCSAGRPVTVRLRLDPTPVSCNEVDRRRMRGASIQWRRHPFRLLLFQVENTHTIEIERFVPRGTSTRAISIRPTTSCRAISWARKPTR